MAETTPQGFLCYARADDQHEQGRLSRLRELLRDEVRFHSGEHEFDIFQDQLHIAWGEDWQHKLDQSLQTALFLIPILTPSFFKSAECRKELQKFLAREQALGRSDLILPIYYLNYRPMHTRAQVHDELVQAMRARQWFDWRDLRFEPLDAPAIRRMLAQMGEQIVLAMERAQESPPSPIAPPAPPRQPEPAPPRQPEPAPPLIVTTIAPGVTMEFVQVPAGNFLMGSSNADPDAAGDEKPQHELYLPTYYIGKTPVTNAQFRPFVEGDGYSNRAYWITDGWQWRTKYKRVQPDYWDDKERNGADYPVVGITWYEVLAYCRWLSVQTGDEYRLPSEAEWEKAARGADGRIYPWGNEAPDVARTNFDSTVGRTTPVGSYPAGASPYGALDMAGNVWEWTRSEHRNYPYDPQDGREDVRDPAGKYFTLRGGSWFNYETYVRCAARDRYDPFARGANLNYGVRVLLSPRVQ